MMIDLVGAFTYAFDDKAWLGKVAVLAAIALVTVLLSPLIIGLLGWAALFGYQAAIIRGWAAGKPVPLPTWDRFGALISNGFAPLVAWLLYQVPSVFVALVFLVFEQNLGGGVFGSSLLFLLCCLALPIVAVYGSITGPMFGLAMGRYAEEGRIGVFFAIGELLVSLRDHLSAATLYVIASLIANILLALLGTLTFGVLPVVLGVLAYAGLNAQLARAARPGPLKPVRPSPGRSR